MGTKPLELKKFFIFSREIIADFTAFLFEVYNG